MDARTHCDGQEEDRGTHAAEEQGADEDLEDALRELEDARREEESRSEAAESGRKQADGAGDRARLEEMAYTPGFNPVADANVQAEREQAERREKDERERIEKEEEERERLRLAAVENRTYMIGRASVDLLSDDLIAFRVLREHAVTRSGRRDTETGEGEQDGQAGEYRDFAAPELVVVTEQAVCTTEQQAVAFSFMQEVDTGRAVVFNRHASSFGGETLRRLVENRHTALRTAETVDRALYPYSFGRPSDKLIAALRIVVLLFAETDEAASTDNDKDRDKDRDRTQTTTRTRRLLTRESVTVVDRAVEREVQAESTEKEARRERRNRSFVDGPSHRREDTPLTPLRHVNSVQIAIDMTGEGDVRRKEEQFRTATPPQREEDTTRIEGVKSE